MKENAPTQTPDSLQAFSQLMSMGVEMTHCQQWTQAVQCFSTAVELKPDSSMAFHQLGLAMCQLGQYQAGIECFDSAIHLETNNAFIFLDKGNALKESGDVQSAIDHYLHAISLKLDYAKAYFNLASIYRQQMRLQEAAACYQTVLQLEPLRADVWSNLGVTMKELGEFDRALAYFDHALEVDSTYTDAKWNKAITLLILGNYQDGWPLFESRWQLDATRQAMQNQHSAVLWLGDQPLHNRSILICTEQGLGDTIQCLRYLPLLVEMGAKVVVEVQSSLIRLISQFDGLTGIMTYGQPRPSTDFYCPFMSLPLAFKTELNSIPFPAGYLKADKRLSDEWAIRLASDHKTKVGLVWSGGELFAANDRRNVALSNFELLGTLPMSFYSLQVGANAQQSFKDLKATQWLGPNIIDHSDSLKDFAETAALIDNLDLVIAVDTSVAHLAGAMGKPTWILNRFDGCWRWLKNIEKSPWYLESKIYNQINPYSWHSAMNRIKKELQNFD